MHIQTDMLKFSLFLSEENETQNKRMAHLKHVEDMPLYNGHKGVKHTSDHLEDVHDMLLGKNIKGSVSTKYNGSQSVMFGKHPQTNQFFVSDGSSNKINYTPEDIDRNHGNDLKLSEKLKMSLEHLPKISPPSGVYHGHLMYTKNDVEDNDDQYHFSPGKIKYSVNKNSAEGQKIKKAKLGIVVDTKYNGNNFENMTGSPETDHLHFKDHNDVHLINPKVKIDGNTIFTPEMQREFRNHMENAKQTYASSHYSTPDVLSGHEELIDHHITDMMYKNKNPSTNGYMQHLQNKIENDVKSASDKERKRQQWSKLIKHVHDNKEHFDNTFKLHDHFRKAKNVLIKALDSSGDIQTQNGHEGYVVNKNNVMTKLAKREKN